MPELGSVAELFATLGLDTTGLTEGLANAKIQLAQTAQDASLSVKAIEKAFADAGGTTKSSMSAAAVAVKELMDKGLNYREALGQILTALQMLEVQYKAEADQLRLNADLERDRVAAAKYAVGVANQIAADRAAAEKALNDSVVAFYKQQEDAAQSLSRAQREQIEQLRQTGAAMTQLGVLTAAVFAPLDAALILSVKTFADFDQAMTHSLAIMRDVTDVQKGEMVEAARQVALTTTISAKDAASAFYGLASAGLSAGESIKSLPIVANFAIAANTNMAHATDLLTKAQISLGLESKNEDANIANRARLADLLVAADQRAVGSAEQFAVALSGKAGAALRLVNKSAEEGVAVLAAFSERGITGVKASEALYRILRDLESKAITNSAAFKTLGIDVYTANGKVNNLADILKQLETRFATMSPEAVRADLNFLKFGDRAAAMIQVLIGTSGRLHELEEEFQNVGGTAKQVADNQMRSFNAQVAILEHNVQDLAIQVGGELVQAFGSLVERGGPLTTVVQGIAEQFHALSPAARAAVVELAAFTAGAGTLAGVGLFTGGQILRAAADLKTLGVTMNGIVEVLGVTSVGGAAGLVGLIGVSLVSALTAGTLAWNQYKDGLDAAYQKKKAFYDLYDKQHPTGKDEAPTPDKFVPEAPFSAEEGRKASAAYSGIKVILPGTAAAAGTAPPPELDNDEVGRLAAIKAYKDMQTAANQYYNTTVNLQNSLRDSYEEYEISVLDGGKAAKTVVSELAGLINNADSVIATSSGKTKAWLQGVQQELVVARDRYKEFASEDDTRKIEVRLIELRTMFGKELGEIGDNAKALSGLLATSLDPLVEEGNQNPDAEVVNVFERLSAGTLKGQAALKLLTDVLHAQKELDTQTEKMDKRLTHAFTGYEIATHKAEKAVSQLGITQDGARKQFEDLPLATKKAEDAFARWAEANKFFGIDAAGNVKAIGMLNTLLDDQRTTLAGGEAAWAKVSHLMKELAKTDLPLVNAEYKKYLEFLRKNGESAGYVLQVEHQLLAERIALRTERGLDTTAEIIRQEQIRQSLQALAERSQYLGTVYVGVRKDLDKMFADLTKGIADNLVEWKSWGDTLTAIGKTLAKNLLDTLLTGLFAPLKAELDSEKGVFHQIGVKLASVVGVLTGHKVPVPNPSSAPDVGGGTGSGDWDWSTGTGSGTTNSSGASSGGAAAPSETSSGSGGIGSLAGITSLATLGVQIASGITQGIQNSRMINLLGEIEISTRQAKEQLTGGIQTSLNTYLPELKHLTDIWGELVGGHLAKIKDILWWGAVNVNVVNGGGGGAGGGADFTWSIGQAKKQEGDNNIATGGQTGLPGQVVGGGGAIGPPLLGGGDSPLPKGNVSDSLKVMPITKWLAEFGVTNIPTDTHAGYKLKPGEYFPAVGAQAPSVALPKTVAQMLQELGISASLGDPVLTSGIIGAVQAGVKDWLPAGLSVGDYLTGNYAGTYTGEGAAQVTAGDQARLLDPKFQAVVAYQKGIISADEYNARLMKAQDDSLQSVLNAFTDPNGVIKALQAAGETNQQILVALGKLGLGYNGQGEPYAGGNLSNLRLSSDVGLPAGYGYATSVNPLTGENLTRAQPVYYGGGGATQPLPTAPNAGFAPGPVLPRYSSAEINQQMQDAVNGINAWKQQQIAGFQRQISAATASYNRDRAYIDQNFSDIQSTLIGYGLDVASGAGGASGIPSNSDVGYNLNDPLYSQTGIPNWVVAERNRKQTINDRRYADELQGLMEILESMRRAGDSQAQLDAQTAKIEAFRKLSPAQEPEGIRVALPRLPSIATLTAKLNDQIAYTQASSQQASLQGLYDRLTSATTGGGIPLFPFPSATYPPASPILFGGGGVSPILQPTQPVGYNALPVTMIVPNPDGDVVAANFMSALQKRGVRFI